MDFYIVQHGQKMRGVLDPGLSELGKIQAQMTGVYLRNADVSKIVSSPLRRARETAQYIADALELNVSFDERLQERMDWKGPTSGLALEDFLEEWDKATTDRAYVPRVGTSSIHAGERSQAVLDELVNQESHAPSLIVTHGGVTIDLLRTVFGEEALNRRNPHLLTHGVPGCGITHIRSIGGSYELVSLAAVGHLQEQHRSDHKPV